MELYLHGFGKPLALQITEEDAGRLHHVLQTWNPDRGRDFFVWHVPNGGAAAVSIADTQLVTSEWAGDTTAGEATVRVPGEEPEGCRILLWLRGREPLWVAVEPDEMVADLLFHLEGGADDFILCLGDTDEFVYIAAGQLVHLYVPRELLLDSEARQDAIREAEEAQEIAAAGQKPTKPSKRKARPSAKA